MVQWLGLLAFTAKGPGSIPGQGTKIPQATRPKKKEKISYLKQVSHSPHTLVPALLDQCPF